MTTARSDAAVSLREVRLAVEAMYDERDRVISSGGTGTFAIDDSRYTRLLAREAALLAAA